MENSHTLSCLLFLTSCVSAEQSAEYLRMEFAKVFCSKDMFFFVRRKERLMCKIEASVILVGYDTS
jgi:hypothetical protein